MKEKKELSLQGIIGEGYTDFWRFQGRYRIVKGSRSSKKSKTAALNLITRMVEHPEANAINDALRAEEILGKHLGLFNDKLRIEAELPIVIIDDLRTDKEDHAITSKD